MTRFLLAALAAASLCAPAAAGTNIKGPPIDLPPEIARDARVDVIRMSSDWVQAREDFSDTFQWQVGAHLNRCAKGSRKLTLRTHVYDVAKEDAVGRLFERGQHDMEAVAEFVDRKTKQVVGRYYMDLGVDSGGFLKALVAEPELMLSEAYGKQLCAMAFAPRRAD
jgi:hypothetical protein